MGPLYRMVTWYKNTLQEGKQYSGTLKRKDILTDVIYLFFLPNSTACHPSRGIVIPSDRFFQGFIRIHKKKLTWAIFYQIFRGGSRIFFRRGGALVSCSTSTPINHIVSFSLQNTSWIRKPQVISEGGGAHPLHPPPRSAPHFSKCHYHAFKS